MRKRCTVCNFGLVQWFEYFAAGTFKTWGWLTLVWYVHAAFVWILYLSIYLNKTPLCCVNPKGFFDAKSPYFFPNTWLVLNDWRFFQILSMEIPENKCSMCSSCEKFPAFSYLPILLILWTFKFGLELSFISIYSLPVSYALAEVQITTIENFKQLYSLTIFWVCLTKSKNRIYFCIMLNESLISRGSFGSFLTSFLLNNAR